MTPIEQWMKRSSGCTWAEVSCVLHALLVRLARVLDSIKLGVTAQQTKSLNIRRLLILVVPSQAYFHPELSAPSPSYHSSVSAPSPSNSHA